LPSPGGCRSGPVGIGNERVPSIAACVEDGFVVEAGWVVGKGQALARLMPSGTVAGQRDMGAGADLLADPGQV
jgi:hypothetical protein